jgi:hypothetical protein
LHIKKEADKPMYVPAPPKILSVLPNGVSIASKATVPTINNLFIIYVSNSKIVYKL